MSSAERQDEKKGAGVRSDVLELYHQCLRVILKNLIEVQDNDAFNGEGYRMYVVGKGKIYLHFEVVLIIGDTVGHAAICCHYKSYTNKIQRPVRSCTVSPDDIDDANAECTFVHMATIFDQIEKKLNNYILI